MKRFLTLCLPLLLSSTLNAQKLAVDGHQWNVITYPILSSPDTYTRREKLEGDTIYNGITYKKVYQTYDTSGTSWALTLNYIREDAAQKVYINYYFQWEKLLYDFSLTVGDTFFIDGVMPIVVTATDSIALNNGQLRKRLKLERPDEPFWLPDYWIEGVGSVAGPFNHFGFWYTDYPDKLLCFYENETLLYPENPAFCFFTDTKTLNNYQIIKVFPNPATDKLHIVDQQYLNDIDLIQVFSADGRLMLNQTVNGAVNEIDVAGFPQGLYCLTLFTENGQRYISRFVRE